MTCPDCSCTCPGRPCDHHTATPPGAEIARAARYPECHEEVTRKGEAQPCEGIAVAVRIDPEGGFYPVCSRHTRRPMVRLGDLIAAAVPATPGGMCVWCKRTTAAKGGEPCTVSPMCDQHLYPPDLPSPGGDDA